MQSEVRRNGHSHEIFKKAKVGDAQRNHSVHTASGLVGFSWCEPTGKKGNVESSIEAQWDATTSQLGALLFSTFENVVSTKATSLGP